MGPRCCLQFSPGLSWDKCSQTGSGSPRGQSQDQWEKHKGRIQLRGRQCGLLARGSGVLREGSGGREGKGKEREIYEQGLETLSLAPML